MMKDYHILSANLAVLLAKTRGVLDNNHDISHDLGNISFMARYG